MRGLFTRVPAHHAWTCKPKARSAERHRSRCFSHKIPTTLDYGKRLVHATKIDNSGLNGGLRMFQGSPAAPGLLPTYEHEDLSSCRDSSPRKTLLDSI